MTLPAPEEAISLKDLNGRIRVLLSDRSVQNCWVRADLSDVAVRGGHCYCELVEKDERTGNTVAKMRGIMWRNNYIWLSDKFLTATGQQLRSGIKVLIKVSVNYHEQYGISLVINDIDPSYTIGDMERQRRQIIERLKREGIYDANRELAFPDVPQRIAVVSAEGAAGYGDFINQLHNNAYGLKFCTCLFKAVMQGQSTVPTVTAALKRIEQHQGCFDCVVIIRGGGSTSDLNSFDSYDLAAAVALFPLPVIVGIGHERDVTVLDYVAGKRVKTPTAAAEWLIARGVDALARVDELRETVARIAREHLTAASQQLQYLSGTIPLIASGKVVNSKLKLANLMRIVPMTAQNSIGKENSRIGYLLQSLGQAARQVIERHRIGLAATADKVELLSPRNTLKRGYSFTTLNGHAITGSSQVKPGDTVVTHLYSGEITSTVK